MRVMVIASGDLWAGAEVMVYQLCCGLQDYRDVELFVVILNQGRLADELESAGIEVHIIDEAQLSTWNLVKNIHHIIKEFSPHLIHSHRYKENLLAKFAIMGMSKVMLVATQHGMPELAGAAQTLKSRLRTGLFFRLLSFGFDSTVLVSDEMRQALLGAYGFHEKKTTVIHNGVAIPPCVAKRMNNRLVVGSAGRLFPVKNYSLMVEIAKVVISKSNDIDFVLAGDGPEFCLLEDKVRAYGMWDRFKFLGHQDDMDAFYRELDVYINTSVHEGIPMSVLEAMGHCLPVVVPKVGGFPEIVADGITGYLVADHSPEPFAEKILGLLRQDCREALAGAARQRVTDFFSREAMARQYHDLYLELVEK